MTETELRELRPFLDERMRLKALPARRRKKLAALWLLILWMILTFRKVDRAAAWLQVPYLLWVTFAAYLNFGVWRLN